MQELFTGNIWLYRYFENLMNRGSFLDVFVSQLHYFVNVLCRWIFYTFFLTFWQWKGQRLAILPQMLMTRLQWQSFDIKNGRFWHEICSYVYVSAWQAACCLNITFSVLLWTFQLVECFCLDLMSQEVEQQKS